MTDAELQKSLQDRLQYVNRQLAALRGQSAASFEEAASLDRQSDIYANERRWLIGLIAQIAGDVTTAHE